MANLWLEEHREKARFYSDNESFDGNDGSVIEDDFYTADGFANTADKDKFNHFNHPDVLSAAMTRDKTDATPMAPSIALASKFGDITSFDNRSVERVPAYHSPTKSPVLNSPRSELQLPKNTIMQKVSIINKKIKSFFFGDS